eukprot:5170351-Amphidinium_carterae.1
MTSKINKNLTSSLVCTVSDLWVLGESAVGVHNERPTDIKAPDFAGEPLVPKLVVVPRAQRTELSLEFSV